jgi:hypothetical protein
VLASQVRSTLCEAAFSPVPERVSAAGEFPASLETESLAEAAPAAAGVNVIAKEADCPSASVVGREMPDKINSLLLVPAAEMVTDDPLALRVPFSAALAPTTTFPKLRFPGAMDNWPWAISAPESAIFTVEAAVDTTVSVPLAEPAAAGVKVTVNVTLCFEESVIGKVSPLIEKPEPLMVTSEIVTEVVPVLVSESERLELLLFCTLPKESVEAEGANDELGLEPL